MENVEKGTPSLPTEPGCTKRTSHARIVKGMRELPETMTEARASFAISHSLSVVVFSSKLQMAVSDESPVIRMLFPATKTRSEVGRVRKNFLVFFDCLFRD